VVGQHAEILLAAGCHSASSQDTADHLAVAWEALFVYDCMIFVLTVLRTLQENRRRGHMGGWLISLVIRDGAIYFAVMAGVQCANTLTFYLSPPVSRGALSIFASSISVTMMSRFMLKLHDTASKRLDVDLTQTGKQQQPEGGYTAALFTTRIILAMESTSEYPGDHFSETISQDLTETSINSAEDSV